MRGEGDSPRRFQFPPFLPPLDRLRITLSALIRWPFSPSWGKVWAVLDRAEAKAEAHNGVASSPKGGKTNGMDENGKIQAAEIALAAMFPDKRERVAAVAAIRERLGVGEEEKEKLLSTAEAAKEAGCTPKTLRSWERRGIVRCFRVTPRRVRWSLAGLRERLGEGKVV